jgi:hypothetical protein
MDRTAVRNLSGVHLDTAPFLLVVRASAKVGISSCLMHEVLSSLRVLLFLEYCCVQREFGST